MSNYLLSTRIEPVIRLVSKKIDWASGQWPYTDKCADTILTVRLSVTIYYTEVIFLHTGIYFCPKKYFLF